VNWELHSSLTSQPRPSVKKAEGGETEAHTGERGADVLERRERVVGQEADEEDGEHRVPERERPHVLVPPELHGRDDCRERGERRPARGDLGLHARDEAGHWHAFSSCVRDTKWGRVLALLGVVWMRFSAPTRTRVCLSSAVVCSLIFYWPRAEVTGRTGGQLRCSSRLGYPLRRLRVR
jgi:hypothetical protein